MFNVFMVLSKYFQNGYLSIQHCSAMVMTMGTLSTYARFLHQLAERPIELAAGIDQCNRGLRNAGRVIESSGGASWLGSVCPKAKKDSVGHKISRCQKPFQQPNIITSPLARYQLYVSRS